MSLTVPQGIVAVLPEAKPGWDTERLHERLVFRALEPSGFALEFQLHLVAGCNFSNASEARLKSFESLSGISF